MIQSGFVKKPNNIPEKCAKFKSKTKYSIFYSTFLFFDDMTFYTCFFLQNISELILTITVQPNFTNKK